MNFRNNAIDVILSLPQSAGVFLLTRIAVQTLVSISIASFTNFASAAYSDVTCKSGDGLTAYITGNATQFIQRDSGGQILEKRIFVAQERLEEMRFQKIAVEGIAEVRTNFAFLSPEPSYSEGSLLMRVPSIRHVYLREGKVIL